LEIETEKPFGVEIAGPKIGFRAAPMGITTLFEAVPLENPARVVASVRFA